MSISSSQRHALSEKLSQYRTQPAKRLQMLRELPPETLLAGLGFGESFSSEHATSRHGTIHPDQMIARTWSDPQFAYDDKITVSAFHDENKMQNSTLRAVERYLIDINDWVCDPYITEDLVLRPSFTNPIGESIEIDLSKKEVCSAPSDSAKIVLKKSSDPKNFLGFEIRTAYPLAPRRSVERKHLASEKAICAAIEHNRTHPPAEHMRVSFTSSDLNTGLVSSKCATYNDEEFRFVMKDHGCVLMNMTQKNAEKRAGVIDHIFSTELRGQLEDFAKAYKRAQPNTTKRPQGFIAEQAGLHGIPPWREHLKKQREIESRVSPSRPADPEAKIRFE